jgi:hypothetical protein
VPTPALAALEPRQYVAEQRAGADRVGDRVDHQAVQDRRTAVRKDDMAQNAYLALTGQKLGEIRGSVTQKGFENLILVIAAQHALISP